MPELDVEIYLPRQRIEIVLGEWRHSIELEEARELGQKLLYNVSKSYLLLERPEPNPITKEELQISDLERLEEVLFALGHDPNAIRVRNGAIEHYCWRCEVWHSGTCKCEDEFKIED